MAETKCLAKSVLLGAAAALGWAVILVLTWDLIRLGRAPGVDAARAELARLEAALSAQTARADSLEAVADSLGRVALGSVDTVRIEVDRYRDVAELLRRQLDSLEAHMPDTAAALAALSLADVRSMITRGDSLAAACSRLASDCDRAIAAKDSALAEYSAAAELHEHRARRLEEYGADLTRRLRSAERRRWIWGLGGAGLSLAMCWAAH